ncbi:MAG: hypothetical protein H6Q26_3388 [Bacteroidetes bacterium]|nr:hypothetical protein [Bacteroidota bacterium]
MDRCVQILVLSYFEFGLLVCTNIKKIGGEITIKKGVHLRDTRLFLI